MAEAQSSEKPQVSTPEAVPPAEKAEGQVVEKSSVSEEKPAEKPGEAAPAASISPAALKAAPVPIVKKSETLEKIEDILEEDLADAYQEMPPEVKKQFRETGEQTAVEIEGMMYKVKVHSKKIFNLLFGWLKIIPKVNKFFLKQEAKLKTDEILHLKEDIDKARQGGVKEQS